MTRSDAPELDEEDVEAMRKAIGRAYQAESDLRFKRQGTYLTAVSNRTFEVFARAALTTAMALGWGKNEWQPIESAPDDGRFIGR